MRDMTEDQVGATIGIFDQALIDGRYEFLADLTAIDFMMVNPLAQTLDKESWLAWLARDIRYSRIERDNLAIRLLPGTAIATSTIRSWMAVTGLFDGKTTIHRTFRSEIWATASGAFRLHHVHLTTREPHDDEP
jgi:hypothetical protein